MMYTLQCSACNGSLTTVEALQRKRSLVHTQDIIALHHVGSLQKSSSWRQHIHCMDYVSYSLTALAHHCAVLPLTTLSLTQNKTLRATVLVCFAVSTLTTINPQLRNQLLQ